MKALLRLPAPWRPFVAVAAIADEFYRPKHRPRLGNRPQEKQPAAPSVQLELFPLQIVRESRAAPVRDSDRPLIDLFPEAYIPNG